MLHTEWVGASAYAYILLGTLCGAMWPGTGVAQLKGGVTQEVNGALNPEKFPNEDPTRYKPETLPKSLQGGTRYCQAPPGWVLLEQNANSCLYAAPIGPSLEGSATVVDQGQVADRASRGARCAPNPWNARMAVCFGGLPPSQAAGPSGCWNYGPHCYAINPDSLPDGLKADLASGKCRPDDPSAANPHIDCSLIAQAPAPPAQYAGPAPSTTPPRVGSDKGAPAPIRPPSPTGPTVTPNLTPYNNAPQPPDNLSPPPALGPGINPVNPSASLKGGASQNSTGTVNNVPPPGQGKPLPAMYGMGQYDNHPFQIRLRQGHWRSEAVAGDVVTMPGLQPIYRQA